MNKYHIIWTKPSGVIVDTVSEWAWMIDKLSIPPRIGEKYEIIACDAATCNGSRKHIESVREKVLGPIYDDRRK